MPRTESLPFFERAGDGIKFLPAERYVAGLRSPDEGVPSISMSLPAEVVDRAVLTGAQLSVWLSAASGSLLLDADGVDDETLEAARAAGPMREQTLLTLIEACLDPQHLSMEDDPVGDLTSLRAQLSEALAKVDGALQRLQRG